MRTVQHDDFTLNDIRLKVHHKYSNNETGFVKDAVDFFWAKEDSVADYHSEMVGTYFEGWFSGQLLRKIPPAAP
ncbi:hypothetical protein HPB47_006493 [Ixodes persulcatus]|uniref:Uncharacterized protein n=1 Tax=Ixodes persulcatus TaxID=34615 RepID=A0AC60PA56_IXOPE|nr:hypothetical protein HPB47_006493 [Ixodes persulcatus]